MGGCPSPPTRTITPWSIRIAPMNKNQCHHQLSETFTSSHQLSKAVTDRQQPTTNSSQQRVSYQLPSSAINCHQQPSIAINSHQQPSTAIKRKELPKLLHIAAIIYKSGILSYLLNDAFRKSIHHQCDLHLIQFQIFRI